MKTYPLCDPYVWENVKVLLYTGFTVRKHPEGPCVSELVNHIVFLYVVAAALGGGVVMIAGWSLPLFVLLALATLYGIPTFIELVRAQSRCEGFQDASKVKAETDKLVAGQQQAMKGLIDKAQSITGTGSADATELYDVIGTGAANAYPMTLPSARNPFMNVLLDEIKYHPKRPMAASIFDPSVKVALDDFFRTEFHRDPTDVFGRSQSQRQFIAMPSTSIPNDQKSYQEWLYKIPGKTCKEGGRAACLPGTDGGALPWLNVNK
jgi:hypothetical protein